MSARKDPFFVGYLPIPAPLRVLLAAVAMGALAFFAALAFATGTTQDNPGDGRLRFDLGRQTVTGVLELQPYPVIHVIEGSEHVEPGETLMMSGAGKFGVIAQAEAIGPVGATVTGIVLNRGSIRMLQIPNRTRDIAEAAVEAELPAAVELGRWRLAGEICDGKCLTGAMRPGRGLAHKACAELCILGGVPPVFVTTQPVAGHEFLMMGSADGGPLSAALLDRTGVYISIEGQVEERGGLAVFLADETTIEVLP